jgi:hypothetical protein
MNFMVASLCDDLHIRARPAQTLYQSQRTPSQAGLAGCGES